MQWLTALLAFATTMLMFAIIVSTLVEMIHRIFGLRSQGLQLMLENLYTRVIEPALAKPDAGAGKQLLTSKQFAMLIMENRATMPAAGGIAEVPPGGRLSRILRRFVDWAMVTDIPVEVFTQKLADNRLVGATDEMTEEVVKDISQKYEAFGKEVSLYFESRARLFSVCIAFVVAWAFYVHPYKLANTYLKNPEIAEAVADKAADVHAQYAVLIEKLNVAAAKPTPDAGSTTELHAAIGELKTKLADAETQTKALKALGAPVGWEDNSQLPSCSKAAMSVDCSFKLNDALWTRPSMANIFWLLVGGLLVGLGAPFWAQAVSSLTASRDVTRRIAEIVTPGRPTATGKATTESVAVSRSADDSIPVATFKASRAGQKGSRRSVRECRQVPCHP